MVVIVFFVVPLFSFSLFITNTSTSSFVTSSFEMAPSSYLLIGRKGFSVYGMNDEMCVATTSEVLSGFL